MGGSIYEPPTLDVPARSCLRRWRFAALVSGRGARSNIRGWTNCAHHRGRAPGSHQPSHPGAAERLSAAADVGVALGSGADISRDTAGVCLLTSDLSRLPWLIRLARRTEHAIRWNLAWAFGYNVAGVGLAATGWLHPVIAAVAMTVSSLLVVANSLALAHFESDSRSMEASP